jgi:hypothetical protein
VVIQTLADFVGLRAYKAVEWLIDLVAAHLP